MPKRTSTGRTDHAPLAGSERPLHPSAKRLGPVNPNERLSITFLLRSRPDGEPVPGLEYWQRTPLGRRNYLSVAEFARVHGAHPDELAAVAALATSHGMTVLESNAASGAVVVKGTVAHVNHALGIKLQRYELPLYAPPARRLPRGVPGRNRQPLGTQRHRGFEGQVHLPLAISHMVTSVIGLDNRRLGGVNTPTGDPPDTRYVTVPSVAQLYKISQIWRRGGDYRHLQWRWKLLYF